VRHARGDDAQLRLRLRARVLVGGVLEVRATEVLVRFLRDGQVEEREDLVLRVGHSLGALRPAPAVLLVEILQVRDDQGVLRPEQGVERGLGHVRLPQDAVDADDPDALRGEQVGGRVQQALPGAGPVSAAAAGGLLRGGTLGHGKTRPS